MKNIWMKMKENKEKTAAVAGIVVLLVACVAAGSYYKVRADKNKAEKEAVKVEAVADNIQPPEIKLVKDKLIYGMNKELEIQDNVIQSITTKDKLKKVSLDPKDPKQKENLILTTLKDGKEKQGVPPMSIKFIKEGTYILNITAEDSKGGKTVMPITFEIGDELISYVQGIQDWTVEVGASAIDFLKEVTWDKEHIKEVTCDSSKVDFAKAGTYELVYTIKGLSEGETQKAVQVTVITQEESSKKADEGVQVLTSNNEVKKDSKGNIPESTVSSSPKAASTKQPAKASVADTKGNEKATEPAKPSDGKAPAETKPVQKPTEKPVEKPAHTHNWVPVTSVVHHDAVTEQRWVPNMVTVVDQAAWDEYIPNEQVRTICKVCGADVGGNAVKHVNEHAVNEGIVGGYYEKVVDVGGTTVHHPAVTHQEDQGHNETVTVQGAWDETVTKGHRCDGCGATK